MKLYYYHDRFAHAQRNADGLDYTPAYLPAILKNLGFTAEALTPDRLSELEAGDLLILGSDILSEKAAAALGDAHRRGCGLIAFGTKAPGVFPETVPVATSDDRYDILGYFRFAGSPEPLPVLGSFETFSEGQVLGSVTGKDGREFPVFSRIGDDIWYFSFDLPATLLYAADGRPTLTPQNNFPIPVGRVPDGCVLEESYDYSIAYGDSYLRRIEDILTAWGFPRIFALPVHDGKISDLLLYFAGDDDAGSRENNFVAAEAMHARGLPYHINIMPGDAEGHFVMDRADIEYLHSIGVETALHYNFVTFPYSEEGHRLQKALYEQTFGESGGGPVNHCVIQNGTAPERYRMEAECGARSENNRLQHKTDPNDINAFNLTGFGFGHAFPRFVLADAAHGNRQLDLCELYCSYYEPRIHNCEPWEYQKLEDYLNAGAAYCRPLQFFHHPHYISGKIGYDATPALRALDHVLAHVKKMGWNVCFCGPDKLGQWWHDRAACAFRDVTSTGFRLDNPTGRALTVVLPENCTAVLADGVECPVVTKPVGERELRLAILAPGTKAVEYRA